MFYLDDAHTYSTIKFLNISFNEEFHWGFCIILFLFLFNIFINFVILGTGAHFVGQDILAVMEKCLPLPLQCWDLRQTSCPDLF